MKKNMERGLKNRHLQMIALGGAIGTGLFYGSASAIKLAGPAITLSFFIGGVVIFFIMRMLGEMCVHEPVSGSFSFFANKYWGPFAGFLSGWSYYTLYVIASMAELTAIGIYMNYWFPTLPHWISALVCLVIITGINLINVRLYGEAESAMSIIKVSAIIAMILLGAFIIFAQMGPIPSNFNNLWAHGGFLPNGLWGVAQSMVIVIFSFAGIELIGTTAAEVQHPERTIPRAINQVLFRIMLFYIGTMIVLVTLFPWNQVGTNGSPFVTIFESLGLPAAANILNVVVLTAAVSVYNSAIYGNSRMLYGLAKDGNAPKILSSLSVHNVPLVGILITSIITFLAVILNFFMPGEVFEYLTALTVAAIMISWSAIVITHLKFRSFHMKQNTLSTISYKSPLYPFTNYLCLALLFSIFCVMYTMDGMRIAVYITPVWVLLLYVGYRLKLKK